ncbi:response regulator transcription factor [Kroppenstedtia pulmonis]|uniref:Response regulator transcription factor n=1 Tax=Kroppenstedtia pulmonis TaxID=1380685 RepID=A0A7D4CN61_9BACL|nr:response regulator transcription factor [Kroppenstedtia pulmonis]QKG84598.1 response regulator transcription factor [Kroppenstedtia pulmonis]
MLKLMIADRDPKERLGLRWLVQSCPLCFDPVLLAESTDEAMAWMEKETPEVICVELDMIPHHRWHSFLHSATRYGGKIIGMTTEATFQRAKQAIDLQAVDLWIKPVSPDRIKRVLNRLCRQSAEKRDPHRVFDSGSQTSLSYQALFIDSHPDEKPGCLWVMQPEQVEQASILLDYLKDYPFQTQPHLFPLGDTIACFFPYQGKREGKNDHTEAHRLLSDWETHQSSSLIIALHSSTEPHLTLRQRYEITRGALELRFFTGYRQVWIAEELEPWRSIDPFLTPSEQREWLEMLDCFNQEKIKDWLYNHFLQLEYPFPDPALLRIRLTSILAQLRRFMQTYSLQEINHYESAYHQIFTSVLHSPLLYRIVQDLLLFIYQLFDGAEESRSQSKVDIVEYGLQYIENHYHRPDLSLQEIARYVNRNESYFSHLLTRKKGASFRQILTRIRLQHACLHLEKTDWPIQEIARQVGFNNPNYFSRIFKEQMGQTPRAYRNQKKIS